MLFTDVDILLTKQALATIRLTTVENHSVYFPVVYSLFKSKDESGGSSEVNYFDDRNVGYWRYFGYGFESHLAISNHINSIRSNSEPKNEELRAELLCHSLALKMPPVYSILDPLQG